MVYSTSDYDTDFMPFVWIPAVAAGAQVAVKTAAFTAAEITSAQNDERQSPASPPKMSTTHLTPIRSKNSVWRFKVNELEFKCLNTWVVRG